VEFLEHPEEEFGEGAAVAVDVAEVYRIAVQDL